MGHSPRSLFNWAILAADFCRSAGSFIPALRYESLEIHKVFLRLSTLTWNKISRHAPRNPPLRTALCFGKRDLLRMSLRASDHTGVAIPRFFRPNTRKTNLNPSGIATGGKAALAMT